MLTQHRPDLLAKLQTKLRSLTLATLIVSTLFMSACGFHLRGNLPLPETLSELFLKAPRGSFEDVLAETIETAGATIVETKSDAKAVLRIARADLEREVGTLDDRGKANSYDLRLKVKYVLETLEGEKVKSGKISENRRYDFDSSQIIDTDSEEQELREDMEQDIALRIVRQLTTVTDLTPIQEDQKDSGEKEKKKSKDK